MRRLCQLGLIISMPFLNPNLCAAESKSETLKGPGSRIQLELSRESILSHESVTLEVTIELTRGAVLIDSGQIQTLKNWIVIHQESGRPTLTAAGGRRWKNTFHLAPTLTGNADFQGLQFSIRPPNQEQILTFKVKQLSVQVKSLLPQSHKLETLKELREPETELNEQTLKSQFSWTDSGAFLGFVAVALGIGGTLTLWVLIVLLKKRRQPASDRQKLLLDEQENLTVAMEGFESHRQIIAMLRAVFSRSVNPHAPSLSALELREILNNAELPEALQSELRDFLSNYDELAFSKQAAPECWTPERLARLQGQIQGFAKRRSP